MVAPRRTHRESARRPAGELTGSGRAPFRTRRRIVLVAAVPLLIAAALPLAGSVASAQPAVPGIPLPVLPTPGAAPQEPPRTADEARQRLRDNQHEAEMVTEQWHEATDALAAARGEADRLQAAVDPLRAEADRARADEESFRGSLDEVTMSVYEDARLDQFTALLVSSSPQDYLDQMSALETLSADRLVALKTLQDKVTRASQAQADADRATVAARAAEDEARKAADELAARKAEADRRVNEVKAALARLSPREIADLNGPGADAPNVPLGTGVGVGALRAAATKLGKPYSWGASGPNSFDCSGLTSWSFKQVGITLPRSSSAQARVGKAVSWDDMQPGDLVFYYNPVSHVGIYAGDGTMINAPQGGDVVKYQKVNRSVFSGARRL